MRILQTVLGTVTINAFYLNTFYMAAAAVWLVCGILLVLFPWLRRA